MSGLRRRERVHGSFAPGSTTFVAREFPVPSTSRRSSPAVSFSHPNEQIYSRHNAGWFSVLSCNVNSSPGYDESVPRPIPGMVVGGKYRILRLLGEGGMGSVFEAENTLTLKRAAIKWLHPHLHPARDASKRMLHEARATARIHHRNVVDIYDVVLDAGSVFLVMELLVGEGLTVHLERNKLLLHELIALLIPAMRGVAAAHAAGVVHRDIKPENIFLSLESDGRTLSPKVIDFGICRIFDGSEAGRLTRSGITMGTPRYVSFEQLRGMRDVDPRADIYAFGVILYEAIVGRPPYDASSFGEQAIRFMTTEPPPPRAVRPALPEDLNRLVLSAIARDRNLRPATMDDLIGALEPYVEPSAYASLLPTFPARTESQATAEAAAEDTAMPESGVLARGAQSRDSPIDVPIRAASATDSRSVTRSGRRRAGWLAAGVAAIVAGAALFAVAYTPEIWPTSQRDTGEVRRPNSSPSAGAAALRASDRLTPSRNVPPLALRVTHTDAVRADESLETAETVPTRPHSALKPRRAEHRAPSPARASPISADKDVDAPGPRVISPTPTERASATTNASLIVLDEPKPLPEHRAGKMDLDEF